MKKMSVRKLCQRNERGRHDAPGPAGCRFSGHLRASACIWEVLDGQTSGDQMLHVVHFVSSACICLRGKRLLH